MRSLLLSIFLSISFIYSSAQGQQNPLEWGQEVFGLFQGGNKDSIVDFLYIKSPELQSILLEDIRAKSASEDLLNKLKDEAYFSLFYEAQKNDFGSRVDNVLAGEQKLDWSKATLDSITYDFVIAKQGEPDIELKWPDSKSFQIDPTVINMAPMKLFISKGKKQYILHLNPIALASTWRLTDSLYLEEK
jgi:hypothetical protein